MTFHDSARPDDMPRDDASEQASEPVHPRYAAPPPSKEVAGEPRILHALALASWVGKLIDPLIHRDKDEPEADPKLP